MAFILLPALLTAQPAKRTLRPADILKLNTLSSGRISPDGKWLAYALTTTDSAKDKRNTDIWMMSWDGKEHIQLTNSADGESNPQWSPDGKYISFVAARNGGTSQVYLLNRLGGEAIKLTDVKGGLGEYLWSPDGKKLALTITDPEDTAAKKNPRPYVINRYRFKVDVTGYQYDTRKTHIYLFDVAAKKLDTLTRGQYDEGGIQWSPDGSRIAFVSNRTEDPDKNSNSDIYIIEARPGATMRQLTTWPGSDYAPQWSPDGTRLAYNRSSAPDNYIMYDHPVLAVIPAAGGEPTLLATQLDRGVTNHRWFANGQKIMAIVTDDCERYVVAFEPATGKMERVIGGPRNFTSVEPHPDGSWLAGMAEAHVPAEWYALENGALRRLTKANDELMNQLTLGRVEKIVSKSKDGATVSSLLFLPPGSDGK
ncbi:MAG: PD40 domain-containing protein, partial [Dinghuibacter sp.]|nr:PD40 domain-containing protein [Dinghuibacter sp.]